jgi:hypothetical protein
MGFKATDFAPISSTGPTALIPAAKDVVCKAFSVARTDTTAALKCVLPADASIIAIYIAGTASDAGTSATISLGTTTTSNELVNAQDVKGAGTYIRPTIVGTAVMQTENLPLGSDIQIYAKYAESGTASTVGSWKVVVEYVR